MNSITKPIINIFINSRYLKTKINKSVIPNNFMNHSKSILTFNILIIRYNPTREFTIKDTIVAIAAPAIPK